MPNKANIIPVIPDEWIAEEAPWSEDLMGRFRDGLKWLHGAIAGLDTSEILQKGTVDSNPVDGGSTSTFTDSNPTDFTSFTDWGHLYVPGLFKGLYIEMVDGAAAGDKFRITEHDLGTGRTDTTESNFTVDGLMLAAGVLAGDEYRVMGHAHNTVFSEALDLTNVDQSLFIASGEKILFNTGSCPTGFTRVTTYDDRLMKISTGAPGIGGGSTTHTHSPALSGNIKPGGFEHFMAGPVAGTIFSDSTGQHNHPATGASGAGNNERLEQGIFICQKT